MEGRATFSKRAAPLLDRLPKGVFRELMFESLATRTGLNRKLLQELVAEQPEKTESFLAPPLPKTTSSAKAADAHEHIPQVVMPRKSEPEWITPPIPDHHLDNFAHPENYDAQETPPQDYQHYYEQHQPRRQANPLTVKTVAAGKYLMPPSRKALALLLSHPQLANLEASYQDWINHDDDEISMLGHLLKVLHERPHYNISHLIGYWRGTYGPESTERLAAVAGHDLLQAANALTQTRQDKPAKADYDTQSAFKDAMEKLRSQQNHKKSAQSLAKLKSADFTQLTKEERERLVHEAMANKREP
jgi:DNA primase